MVAAPRLEPLHVVLPIRSISGGKARLGEALDAEEREELVLGMLINTLDVLAAWPSSGQVHLVTADPLVGPVGGDAVAAVHLHAQAGEGLNEGISIGVRAALESGASSVLVLPGDIPDLASGALDSLLLAADAAMTAALGGPIMAIAPADAGGGTNALLLRPPDSIAPAFGPDSFAAHLRAAAAAGVAVQLVSDPVLGFDLDTPDDLERLDPARLAALMAKGRDAADRVVHP